MTRQIVRIAFIALVLLVPTLRETPMTRQSVTAALTILSVLVALYVIVRWATGVWAPPEAKDPRRGRVVFWIFAGTAFVAFYALFPLLESAGDDSLIVCGGLALMLRMEARLGLARRDDELCETHEILRNHQDGWAVLLGMFVALTIRVLAFEGFHF